MLRAIRGGLKRNNYAGCARNFLESNLTNSEVRFVGLEESITGWIVEPWVVVGASHTSLQIDGFPGNFLGGQFAGVWHPTGWLAINDALLPPWFEVLDLRDRTWILDPLDNLGHGDEVHIVVVGEDLIDPVREGVQEFGVVLQPGSVEVQTKWGTVLFVVTIEVVVQEVVELITGEDVRAGVHHSAPGQVLVVGWILSAIQLVHDHFPDSVRAGRAALQITVAAVWHAEVHGVWP